MIDFFDFLFDIFFVFLLFVDFAVDIEFFNGRIEAFQKVDDLVIFVFLVYAVEA